jgi:hypothetical protein
MNVKTLVKIIPENNSWPLDTYTVFHLYSRKNKIGLWNAFGNNDSKEQDIQIISRGLSKITTPLSTVALEPGQ